MTSFEKTITVHARRGSRRLAETASRLVERAKRVDRLFAYVVILPTALAILYFGLIARDIYVSESHFVVRSPQRQLTSGIGGLLQGAGLSPANDDVYSVQDFLASRDALQKLDEQFHLKESFGSPGLDLISRFPGIDWDDSFESLWRYYQKHIVSTDLDTTSSILALTVRAFSAEEAFRINEKLLEMSEDLVNKLNERSRQDLVRLAASDVDLAEQKVKAAVVAVSNFRNKKSVFDPEKQSGLQLEQIARLQADLIATRKQIADVRTVARENPQIPFLENRAKVLQAEIDSETAKVAGGKHSLSTTSAGYEGLVLERDFAGKRLEIALASLEQARENAMRQQIYVERINQPNKPDVAIEPRRIRAIAATFMLSLIVWGVLSLLITAVKEHVD